MRLYGVGEWGPEKDIMWYETKYVSVLDVVGNKHVPVPDVV